MPLGGGATKPTRNHLCQGKTPAVPEGGCYVAYDPWADLMRRRESSKATGGWSHADGNGIVRAVTEDGVYVIYTSGRRRTISAFTGTSKGEDDG